MKFDGPLKEDLCVILGGDSTSRKQFWAELFKRGCFFKVLVEGISNTGANALDLRVFKGPHWQQQGALDIGIYFKPTALGMH